MPDGFDPYKTGVFLINFFYPSFYRFHQAIPIADFYF